MVARPLRVKHSVLNAMTISPDLKHEIWLRARRGGGPLVQRVSETTMVAKCRPDRVRHPLGYLHVTFHHSDWTEPRMWCACANRDEGDEGETAAPCIHFYACVAVFASDERLSEEFGFFVALQHELLADSSINQVITILGQDENGETIKVEVLDEAVDHFKGILMQEEEEEEEEEEGPNTALKGDVEEEQVVVDSGSVSQVLEANLLGSGDGDDGDIRIEMATPDGGIHTISAASIIGAMEKESEVLDSTQQQGRIEVTPVMQQKPPPKRRRSGGGQQQISLLSHQSSKRPSLLSTSQQANKPTQPKPPLSKTSCSSCPMDEASVSLSFVDWLSGVTERLNQCMHYGFDGRPDPLVFHAPNAFFECLRERMTALVGGKRRLPNHTVTFVQQDSLPRGTFTKYTWKLVNVLQVRQF